MADLSATLVCTQCGGSLEDYERDRGTCHNCRSLDGKITDLDIAIRASDDLPERIELWPVIRHFLRKRFGENRSSGELWERCTDWLSAEVGLDANDYLPLPLTVLVRILGDSSGITSDSDWNQHWGKHEQDCIAAALLPAGAEKNKVFYFCRIKFAELKASSFASKGQTFSDREELWSKVLACYINDGKQLDSIERQRLIDWLKAPEPKLPFPYTTDKNLARLATYWALTTSPEPPGDSTENAGGILNGETQSKIQRDNDHTAIRLLNVFTNGLADERLKRAGDVLNNKELRVEEKLWKIDELMPIPPTVSAANLGKMLGASKTAIQKTKWYVQKRKGQKANEVARRQEQYTRRGKLYEPDQ